MKISSFAQKCPKLTVSNPYINFHDCSSTKTATVKQFLLACQKIVELKHQLSSTSINMAITFSHTDQSSSFDAEQLAEIMREKPDVLKHLRSINIKLNLPIQQQKEIKVQQRQIQQNIKQNSSAPQSMNLDDKNMMNQVHTKPTQALNIRKKATSVQTANERRMIDFEIKSENRKNDDFRAKIDSQIMKMSQNRVVSPSRQNRLVSPNRMISHNHRISPNRMVSPVPQQRLESRLPRVNSPIYENLQIHRRSRSQNRRSSHKINKIHHEKAQTRRSLTPNPGLKYAHEPRIKSPQPRVTSPQPRVISPQPRVTSPTPPSSLNYSVSLLKKSKKFKNPIFGIDLGDTRTTDEQRYSTSFVKNLTEIIESQDLKTEGLYRVPGELTKVQKHREFITKNLKSPDKWIKKLQKEENVHVQMDRKKNCGRENSEKPIFFMKHHDDASSHNFQNFEFTRFSFSFCGLLKSFFRDIKHGLISKALLVKFTNITTCDLLKREIQIHNTVFRVLPIQHQTLLKLLILHLRKVIQVDNNGMSVENVSKIFAPTLINIQGRFIKMSLKWPEWGFHWSKFFAETRSFWEIFVKNRNFQNLDFSRKCPKMTKYWRGRGSFSPLNITFL